MEEQIRILLLGEPNDDITQLEDLLEKDDIPFISETAPTKPDYENQLQEFKPDVVIAAPTSEIDPIEALQVHKSYREDHHPPAIFILVTGKESEEVALEALDSGADDYLFEDRLRRLPAAIRSARERNLLKEQRRKEEEEKLHLSNILHKSLHEIFVVDPESLKIEYANQEGLKNLGYSQEELQGKGVREIIADFDEEKFRRMLTSVERSQKGRIYERYAVRKDRSRYPVQIHLELVVQGKRKKLLANILDITETKEHQEQKELALFIQNCFNEDRSLNISLEIILEEFCKRFGIPAAEVWVRDIAEIGIKREAFWCGKESFSESIGSLLAQEAFNRGEIVRKGELQLEGRLKELHSPAGDKFEDIIAYPVSSGSEITAAMLIYTGKNTAQKGSPLKIKEGVQDKLASNIKRKKTEEELQKIFEFSPDVLAVIGKDGYIRKINPSWQKILGYTQEEMLSRSFEDLIHPEDKDMLQEWKDAEMQDNEVNYYESRWRAANGEFRWFAWSVTPFLKKDLEFAVGKDITDFKEQVEAIKEQNEKLAEIAWEQSHVVRAPLSRLLACVSYLEENEEYRDVVLQGIKDSAQELDQIVKTIVSKTERITKDEEN